MSWHGGQTQQYAMYIDGYDLLGVVEFTPPEFTQKTITLGGSGILGEIELPAPGLYEKMEAEIKFNQVSQPAFKLLDLNNKLIELKAVINGINGETHAIEGKGFYFAIQGSHKSFSIGAIKVGELSETAFKMELTSIEARLDGQKLFKINKLSGIVEQLGVAAIKKITDYVF